MPTLPETPYNDNEYYINPDTKLEIVRAINHSHDNGSLNKTAALNELEKQLLRLPEYIDYQKQQIKLETFDQIIHDIKKQLSNTENDELKEKTLSSIESLAKDIKSDMDKYYRIIIECEHFGRVARLRMVPEDFAKESEKKDRHRTIIHNSLISNLKAFTRFCYRIIPERFEQYEPPKTMLFSSDQLNDRKLIGAWAYSTEFGKRIEETLDLIHQKKTEEAGE